MREGPGEGWALGAVRGGWRTGEWHGVAPGRTFGQICIFRSPWSLQGRRRVWKAGPVRKQDLPGERQRQQGEGQDWRWNRQDLWMEWMLRGREKKQR